VVDEFPQQRFSCNQVKISEHKIIYLPMHSLSKMLFFTAGTVGLLVLVFLWAALSYGLLSLDHLIHSLVHFKIVGLTLPDYFAYFNLNGIGESVSFLKNLMSVLIGVGSFYLIIISYLPKISLQMRFLNFGISLVLLIFLVFFWLRLIEGDEVIAAKDRIIVFILTIISYSLGIVCLWAALRSSKRVSNHANKRNQQNSSTSPRVAIQSATELKESTPKEVPLGVGDEFNETQTDEGVLVENEEGTDDSESPDSEGTEEKDVPEPGEVDEDILAQSSEQGDEPGIPNAQESQTTDRISDEQEDNIDSDIQSDEDQGTLSSDEEVKQTLESKQA
jgi:hypothetical protein